MTPVWRRTAPNQGRYAARLIALLPVLAVVAVVGRASNAGADTTAPEITNFDISPTTIDTGSGDKVVSMKYSAIDLPGPFDTDAPSGVARVVVNVTTPTGATLPGVDLIDPPLFNPTDRIVPIKVKQFSAAGDYTVDTVDLIDHAGNSQSYPGFLLNFVFGFPYQFHNDGSVVDNTAPVLSSFDISPLQIDTSNASAIVTLSFTVTDDHSGIKSIEFTVTSDFDPSVTFTMSRLAPADPPVLSIVDTAEVGDQVECNNGQCHTVLPQYSLPGKYHVTQVKLIDHLGNSRTMSTSDLSNAGFPTFFENTAQAYDNTAPQLTSMTASPTFVDARNGPAVVKLNYTATDDLSGFKNISVEVDGPGGTQLFGVDSASPPSTQHSGSIPISVNKGAFAGTYTVSKVTLTDKSGNKRNLGPQSASFQVGNCSADAQCSDDDLCTADSCNPQVGCSHVAPTCAPGDACHHPGVCDPNTGQCVPPVAVPNGSPCDDGTFCNGQDLCINGACSFHPGDPCALNPECNRVCHEATHSCAVTQGTACSSDGNPCTVDQCDGSGACAHSAGNAGAVCRPKAGPCDVAEQCDGASASCPANQFIPSGQVCRVAANACEVDASCDGSSASCPANGGPGDDDGDGICDNADACINIDDGRNFLVVTPGRVRISQTGSGQKLRIDGTFNIAPPLDFGDVDPTSDGARVVITSQAGTVKTDIHLPAGAYAGGGSRGWQLSPGGSMWTYKDSTGAPVGGIVKMSIRKRSPRTPTQVLVSVVGEHASYPIVPADLPIQATVVLGNQSASATGKCGQSLFEPKDCSFDASQKVLKCRM